jgi:hypothetical protein
MPGVGKLIYLDAARGHRDNRLAAAALHARMHPALRWLVGDDSSTAHRRTPLGRAVCGAPGRLLLADDPDTPLCGGCYPSAQQAGLGA